MGDEKGNSERLINILNSGALFTAVPRFHNEKLIAVRTSQGFHTHSLLRY